MRSLQRPLNYEGVDSVCDNTEKEPIIIDGRPKGAPDPTTGHMDAETGQNNTIRHLDTSFRRRIGQSLSCCRGCCGVVEQLTGVKFLFVAANCRRARGE
jgi:hypothetical protein